MGNIKKPIVLIINGYPRSGKDTFCNILGKKYKVLNHSTVDRVKEIAILMGWDGIKTPKSREMLSDLKDFTTKWFDMSYNDIKSIIKGWYNWYKKNEDVSLGVDFICIHVREPDEIKKIVDFCNKNCYTVNTVFIRRDHNLKLSNYADKNVEDYEYDVYIDNNSTLDDFTNNVFKFISVEFGEKFGENDENY